MSTRRKKKETPEKIPKPTYKGSSISIDPSLLGRFSGRGRNPLDAELESEDSMLAQELKSMRVDEVILKRRARMAKLQKELDKLEKESGGLSSNNSEMPRLSVAMAQQIANLPENERNKVLETYAMFRSIDHSKGRGGDSLLPLLIGYSKSNPGTQQSDMAVYAKAMSDQFQSGIAVMQSVIPKEKPSNATELLKIFRDLVADSVKKPMEELAKNMTAQPSAFEQILMNPEMFGRAKEIGMFGSREPRTGSTNVDLEIEKLRGERQLEIKKMDLDWRKALLESEAKGQRGSNMMAMLAPLTAIVAGPVSQRMQKLGEQQGATHIPPVTMPSVPTGTTILLRCSCGHEGPMNFPGQPPSLINCPSCGQELLVGGTPPGKPE